FAAAGILLSVLQFVPFLAPEAAARVSGVAVGDAAQCRTRPVASLLRWAPSPTSPLHAEPGQPQEADLGVGRLGRQAGPDHRGLRPRPTSPASGPPVTRPGGQRPAFTSWGCLRDASVTSR